MKRQISNTNMNMIKGFLIGVFLLLFIGYSFFFWINSLFNSGPLFNSIIPLIILILFPFFYYVFIGRFNRIELDESNLYYHGLFKKGRIPLKDLLAVNNEWLPYKLFFKRAYGITISYRDNENKKRKIKFLSKEISLFDTPGKIIELIELRRIIKKNSC